MNDQKYKQAFKDAFGIEEERLEGLRYQAIPEWDSVGHMVLIAAIEDAFDIMMETDDVIDLDSYEKGREMLAANYGVKF